MRVYLDTNVLVYAIGGDSAHRDPCREILRAVAERRLEGETSAYTVQEFVRQRRRRGDREAIARARYAIDICADLHPVDGAVVRQAIEIASAIRDSTLPMRFTWLPPPPMALRQCSARIAGWTAYRRSSESIRSTATDSRR